MMPSKGTLTNIYWGCNGHRQEAKKLHCRAQDYSRLRTFSAAGHGIRCGIPRPLV